MLRSIWLSLLLLNIVDGITNFRRIENATYISPNMTNVLSYNGTCDECICQTFIKNTSSNYQGLNCYKNKTCLSFTNYILMSMIHINLNSTFIFKQSQLLPTTNRSNFFFFLLLNKRYFID